MPRVFISHASEDRDFVEGRLIPLLNRHSIDFWHSTTSIESASHWESSIRAALIDCSHFVVVLTPAALASRWVRAEVAWWLGERCDAPYARSFVPLVAADCRWKDLHLMLREFQALDFRSVAAEDSTTLTRAVEQLIETLGGRATIVHSSSGETVQLGTLSGPVLTIRTRWGLRTCDLPGKAPPVMALSAHGIHLPDGHTTVRELLSHFGADVVAGPSPSIVGVCERSYPQHLGILLSDGRVLVLPDDFSLTNATLVGRALPSNPTCAAFLPGGGLLAGYADGSIAVATAEGGMTRLTEPDGSPVVGVFPSSRSALLAVFGNGIAIAWSLPSLTRVRRVELPDAVSCASAGESDLSLQRFVAIGCRDGTIHLLDFTGATANVLFAAPLPVSQVSLIHGFLGVRSGDEVVLWTHADLNPQPTFVWTLPDDQAPVSALAQFPADETYKGGVPGWIIIRGHDDGRLLCTAIPGGSGWDEPMPLF